MDAKTIAERGISGKTFRLRPSKEFRLKEASFTLAQLLAEPAFAGVTELDFAEHGMKAGVVEALLAWPHLEQLELLDLTWNQIGWDAADKLFACERLAGLKVLRLSSSFGMTTPDRSQKSIAKIAAGTALVGLEELQLADMHAESKGAEVFGAIKGYARLARLGYRADEAKGKQVEGLAANPILENLTSLDVSTSGVTAKQLATLLKSGKTRKLRALYLENNPLKSAGWAAIAASAGALPDLELLQLEQSKGDEAALLKLSKATLPALRHLDLSWNEGCGTQAAFTALAQASFLPQLKYLSLLRTKPSAEALQSFVAAARLDAIEELQIDHEEIGDQGVSLLRSHPNLAGAKIRGIKSGVPGLATF